MVAPKLQTPREVAGDPPPGISKSSKVLERQLRAGLFPVGVAVKVGARWFINADALVTWLAAGGSLAEQRPAA
ncbi:MAG: hypothetical protein ACHQQS_06585 [Thermoanaerobaculales bacterium]